MTRLFDGNREAKAAAAERDEKDAVRRRVEEAEEILKSYEETDAASKKMAEAMGAASTVTSIVYKTYRAPGSKWVIEHAEDGEDYVYQLFPLREPAHDWTAVVPMIAIAVSVVFPDTFRVEHTPPNDQYGIKFYTVKIRGVVNTPGWKRACTEQAPRAFSSIEAW